MPKDFGFSVLVFIAVCGCFVFCFWFSVFVENTSGFSVLLSNGLFGFSYFVLFGFPFLRFERQLISNRVFNLYLTTVQFISHIETICTVQLKI